MVKTFDDFVSESKIVANEDNMIEYGIEWVAYSYANQEDYNYDEAFDNKKQALKWLKDNDYSSTGRVACCAGCTYPGGASDFAYAKTERDAVAQLKKYAAEYGYVIYDPFKVK